MATLSLGRLCTIYNQTAVGPRSRKRDLARTQLAFYSAARGVLKVLDYLIEHGDYEELHQTIERHGREIARIRRAFKSLESIDDYFRVDLCCWPNRRGHTCRDGNALRP